MPVLVDTSVWIDFFRGRPTAEVDRFKAMLGSEEVLIGDLILAEILQGIHDKEDLIEAETALKAFQVVPLVGEEIARESAFNYRLLRAKGITVRKTIDCLIATWCIRNSFPLLHADRDFRPFAALGLIEL
jgi:predicted nucleic acid-binding protein